VLTVGEIESVRTELLDRIDAVEYVFTTRQSRERGVPLDFDYRKEGDRNVARSYNLISRYFKVGPDQVYVTHQVHGDGVELVVGFPDESMTRGVVENDSTVTGIQGLVLTVLTADCVPILLAHKSGLVIAVVHAGWRGTVLSIGAVTIKKMVESFGVDPGEIVAAIGPSIGQCCYEVGEEVISAVSRAFPFAGDFLTNKRDGHAHLDLPGLNRRILVGAGLRGENIWSSGFCTACHPELFYSYRRDGPGTGRMMNGIVMRG
jgi:YfiH family protein